MGGQSWPLPQWFIDTSGTISPSLLLSLWKEAIPLVMHKRCSGCPRWNYSNLDNLTFECKRFGVEAPSPLSSEMMENVAVSEWLEQGLVVPVERADNFFL